MKNPADISPDATNVMHAARNLISWLDKIETNEMDEQDAYLGLLNRFRVLRRAIAFFDGITHEHSDA